MSKLSRTQEDALIETILPFVKDAYLDPIVYAPTDTAIATARARLFAFILELIRTYDVETMLTVLRRLDAKAKELA